MKLIKVFDNFNLGYEKIQTIDIPQFSRDKSEKFTLSEIDEIKNNISELLLGEIREHRNARGNSIYFQLYKVEGFKEYRRLLNIYKYKDEWFNVNVEKISGPSNIVSYKCDQLDGLINCLKSICQQAVCR